MSSIFRFSRRSLDNLRGVHPSLVQVAHRALALTTCDFTVVEGLRTKQRQLELVAKGASRTTKSKHLCQDDGYGHAIDVYPYWGGTVHTEDSRENLKKYDEVSAAFKAAAAELGVPIVWGGDWRTFVDQPHYELNLPRKK